MGAAAAAWGRRAAPEKILAFWLAFTLFSRKMSAVFSYGTTFASWSVVSTGTADTHTYTSTCTCHARHGVARPSTALRCH